MADKNFPGYVDPASVIDYTNTAGTATKRNREGLPSQRDITGWRIELETANAANAANYQMNKENNLLQMELANQAYERSTAKNQLKELMAAGLTEQQARQAIAGNGEGATQMPVASTQAPTIMPASVSPASGGDAGLAGSMLQGGLGMAGDLFSVLSQSLLSKDGGALGWSIAQPYMSQLTDLVDKGYISPDDMCLPADLVALGNSMEDGEAKSAVLDVAHGKHAYTVASQPLGMRGAQSWLEGNYGFKTSSQNIKESLARTQATEAAKRLTEYQIVGRALDNVLTSLNIPYQQTQNEIATLIKQYQMTQNNIAANDEKLSELELEVQERTNPYVIEETIGRAQAALAQYEIEFAYKRMNQNQIIHAMENDLDVQIAMALANKVYWQNQHLSESAFGQEAFKDNEEGQKVMKGLYRIYGTCKRFGATPFTNATQAVTATGVAAGAGSALFKVLAPKPVKVLGFH